MEIDFNIKFNPKQEKILGILSSFQYEEILLYGTSRSGKTFAVLWFFMILCTFYKVNCLIIRNTFTALDTGMIQQTLPDLKRAIQKLNNIKDLNEVEIDGKPFMKWHGKRNTLTFHTGNYIQFAGLTGSENDESSLDKILSTQWGAIFADEVSEIAESAIEMCVTRAAEPIVHPHTGEQLLNPFILAENPPLKTHWTYRQFFKHENRHGVKYDEERIKYMYNLHFDANDNKEFVAESYWRRLSGLSEMMKKRFYDGEFSDEAEGEIFTSMNWAEIPEPDKFEYCVVYTDPSAKDKDFNDFKASVLLGISEGKIYLIDLRAVQGTAMQMIENMHYLYKKSPIEPALVIENKQLPLDFELSFDIFMRLKKCSLPLIKDNTNYGQKFFHITNTLQPLFKNKRFLINSALKEVNEGQELTNQFIYYSGKGRGKDDIPDACAKGTSWINRQFEEMYDDEEHDPFEDRVGIITPINSYYA